MTCEQDRQRLRENRVFEVLKRQIDAATLGQIDAPEPIDHYLEKVRAMVTAAQDFLDSLEKP